LGLTKWKGVVSNKRHIAKTITWRVVGTLDTILITFLLTGSITMGLSIGGIETITKMILYYFHERVWYKYSKFGLENGKKETT
jgi:uncharacterized membrane protein